MNIFVDLKNDLSIPIYILSMNLVDQNELCNIKEFFQNQLLCKLRIQKQCRAKTQQGTRCTRKVNSDKSMCKIHTNSSNIVLNPKVIVYHNHLPFEKSDDCPMCL